MAKKLSTFVFGGNLPATLMRPSFTTQTLSQANMEDVRRKSPTGKVAQQRKQAEIMRVKKAQKSAILSLVGDISQELAQQAPIQIQQGSSIKAQQLAIARQKKGEKSAIQGIIGTVSDELIQLQQTPVTLGVTIQEQQQAVIQQRVEEAQQKERKTKAEVKATRQASAQRARDIHDIDKGLNPPRHKSSHVTAINYDEWEMKLYVEFNNQALYEYNLANHPLGPQMADKVLFGLEWCRTDDPTGQRRWWRFKQPSHGAAVYWDLYKKGVPYKRIR